MRHILTLTIIILAFGCSSKKDNSKQTDSLLVDSLNVKNRTLYFDSITPSEFETIHYDGIKNIDSVSVDTTKIRIKHDSILIFPQNGKTIVFASDTIESDAMVLYKYLKTIKSCNSIEIEATYWEWRRIFLVSLLNGKKTELWDFPNFSPDKKYFISCSANLDYAEMPNGFQLFKVEKEGIKMLFEKEIDNWEANEIKWKSDSTIYIKRAKLDKKGDRKYDYLKTKIVE